MFTSTRLQGATYLLGVCLFSISFLVFLNASVSFVITKRLHVEKGVGDYVGSLGFADELVAIIACPVWGILSDRIGVRPVCVIGYAIVGLALIVFVQANNVYPQLLLARIFFSLGGAATATMVTAILPAMTTAPPTSPNPNPNPKRLSAALAQFSRRQGHTNTQSISSDVTITPERFNRSKQDPSKSSKHASAPRLAGLVGMFTGCGALVALVVFLPLPARFEKYTSPSQAVADSYYVVGSVSFLISIFCFFGLRNLNGEQGKGFHSILTPNKIPTQESEHRISYHKLLVSSITLGFKDVNIGLGYLGGFVARASSVGISLFIPLFINAYFLRAGLCKSPASHSDPEAIKRECRRAYTLAAELTGVSQLIALLTAPVFGYLSDRYRRFNVPLLCSSAVGILGFTAFGALKNPEPSFAVFAIVICIGVSQIGAIVCSLGLLGRGVLGAEGGYNLSRQLEGHSGNGIATAQNGGVMNAVAGGSAEQQPLLPNAASNTNSSVTPSLTHLKGSIAGVYSLAGGAGILLLTKLGGLLFDSLSTGAPFYMLAMFNGALFAAVSVCGVVSEIDRRAGTRMMMQQQH